MPTVTLTLNDTPNGAVSIHSTFKPAVGNPCSAAQAHALDVIARTHKQWGVHLDAAPGGVDMAAVHRLRPVCGCAAGSTMQDVRSSSCIACGQATP